MNFHQIFLFLQRIEKFMAALESDCLSNYAHTIASRDMKDCPQYNVINGVIAAFSYCTYTETEYAQAKIALGMAYNMMVSDITRIVDHIFNKADLPDSEGFIFAPKVGNGEKIIQFKNM